MYVFILLYIYTHLIGYPFSRNPSWPFSKLLTQGWEEILEVTIGIAPRRPVGLAQNGSFN